MLYVISVKGTDLSFQFNFTPLSLNLKSVDNVMKHGTSKRNRKLEDKEKRKEASLK